MAEVIRGRRGVYQTPKADSIRPYQNISHIIEKRLRKTTAFAYRLPRFRIDLYRQIYIRKEIETNSNNINKNNAYEKQNEKEKMALSTISKPSQIPNLCVLKR